MHNQIPVVYKSLLDFLKVLILPASDFAIYIVITSISFLSTFHKLYSNFYSNTQITFNIIIH